MGSGNGRKKSYASIAGLEGSSQTEVRARNVKLYGAKIREARQNAGMTTDELASRLDITRNSILNWESGYSRPDLEYLARTFRILGMNPNDFFDASWIPPVPDARDSKLLDSFHSLHEVGKLYTELFLTSLKEATAQLKRESIASQIREVQSLGRTIGEGSISPKNKAGIVLLRHGAGTENADEVLSITGNFLEPLFHHDDCILIQYVSKLLPGELGVVAHPDGSLVLRQAIFDGRLLPLTSSEVDNLIKEEIVGRVICKVTNDMVPTEEEEQLYRETAEQRAQNTSDRTKSNGN